MENKDYSIKKITRKNILSFENYIPENKLEMILERNTAAIGLVTGDNRTCGALMYSFYPDEGTAILESLCVDESIRRQGLGTMLYETFEEDVYQKGMEEIGAHLILPEQGDVQTFLAYVGFDNSEQGERYYRFTKGEIKEWLSNPTTEKIRKQNADVSGLAVSVSETKKGIRDLLPDIPYDPELSYVFWQKEKKNYFLADSDENGNIVVLKAELDVNDSPAFFMFAEAVMENYAKKLTDHGGIYITLTDERQTKILETLSYRSEISFSYGLDMAKTIEDGPGEKITMPHVAFLIPRINGLSKMLSDFGDGYEHSLTYTNQDAIISLLREDDRLPVYIHYEVADDDKAEEYELSIQTCIYRVDLTDEQIKRVSSWKEESSLCSFIEDDEGRIFVRAAVLENRGLTDPDFFKTVLDGFIAEIDNMCGTKLLNTAEA